VQDFVALEGAQQRGPDAQEGCLPCGRRAGAVDDAVEDCGGHERAWDRVRMGLGGRGKGYRRRRLCGRPWRVELGWDALSGDECDKFMRMCLWS